MAAAGHPAGGAAPWLGIGDEGLDTLGLAPSSAWNGAAYDVALQRTWQRVARGASALQAETRDAPRRIEQLLALPPNQRPLLVANSPSFATYSVVQGLIHRARDGENGRDAKELSTLALSIVERLPEQHYPTGLVEDVSAHAWGELAAAQEMLGRLHAAERSLLLAEMAQGRGSGDTELVARLLVVRARLTARRFRTATALEHLRAARQIYRDIGDLETSTALRILSGRWLLDSGRASEASWMLRRALRGAQGVHRFEAVCTLAEASAALGDVVKARRQLATLALESAPSPAAAARLAWLEGCVAAAEGSPGLAVHFFREAREAFFRLGRSDEADRAARALERL